MTEAAQAVKTGEVTWATRDSKDAEGNPIAEGDVIGIADGSIEAVDDSIDGAVLTLLGKMEAEDADTCTILAGEGYSDEDLEALVAKNRGSLRRAGSGRPKRRAASVPHRVLG